MRFIHCADLHLDSKMESNLQKEKAAERRAELVETFEEIVNYAKENDVRAIIIAGDMFDTKNSHIRIKRRVRELIEAADDIDFLYLKGNHDNADFLGESEKPENLKLFNKDWTTYSYDNIDISGSEATDNADMLKLDGSRLNIVVMHGQEKIGSLSDDYTIDLSRFTNRGIDYLALGHIHSYKSAKLDERGVYCYSGCPEGRGFDECGEKGFVLLNINDGSVSHEFIPFARRTIHTVNVKLDGVMTINEIIDRIDAQTEHIPSGDMVKIILEGEIDEETDIDLVYIQRRCDDKFYFVKLADETTLRINYEEYKNDVSLKGEFIRLVNSQDINDERKKSIILTGLKALAGREIDI